MKLVKKLLFIVAFLTMLCGMGIVVCAWNPTLTDSLASKLDSLPQGEKKTPTAEEADTSGGTSIRVNEPGIRSDLKLDGGSAYVTPESTPENLPEAVSGRSGYVPVDGAQERVAGDEAEDLSSTLSTGNLGGNLSFSEEIYPYYAMLEEDMKLLYKQIYANACDLNPSFSPVVTVNVNSLKNVFEAVCNDHPELFWLDTGYSCKYLKSGQCVEISLKFNSTADDLSSSRERFDSAAEKILAGAGALGSDREKEKYVHDALVNLVTYDETAALSQSAYSALVNGATVCAGYARAFQYLMQQLGIPCYYCTGYSGQDHAWDIVKLEGAYANVDVTWDDTDPSTYDYYNKSDEAYSATHMRTGLSVYLPACTGLESDPESDIVPAETEESTQETPVEPLGWVSKTKFSNETDSTTGSAKTDKEAAGVTDNEIMDTMEKYYADCKTKMIAAGKGSIVFNNVVPESLWNTIERAYSDGSYKAGYADAALKEMNAGDFFIQVQAQRLGGGYYRIYHSIYTN